MKKTLKFLFSSLTLILVLLFSAPFFVDVNDYKPEISQAVHDATGRELHIEHIKLSVFPWIGFTLKNVQLQNSQGFKQEHFMTVKEVDVQLKLIPLLSQHIEIERFTLDTPIIWLQQRADGSNNWEDLQQQPRSAANGNSTASITTEPSTAEQAPLSLNAEILHLHDGQIFWSQENSGKLELSNIQLKVFNLQFKEPIGIDFSARLGTDTVNIHAKVGPLHNINHFDIAKLPIHIQVQSDKLSLAPLAPWLPVLSETQAQQFGALKDSSLKMNISAEQHADGMLVSSGFLQANMKNTFKSSWKVNANETLSIQKFNLDINDTHVLTLSGAIKHFQSKPNFEIRLETAALQRQWLNQLLPSLEDTYRDHPQPWQLIKIGTFISGDENIIAIRDLQLLLDDEPVQISGNIALGTTPDIQLRISTKDLHLDPWIPQQAQPQQHTLPTQNVAAVHEVEPDLTFLKSWYLSVQLNATSIHVMKLKLDNLRLTLSAEKGVVRLNPLRFGIGNGQITENFTLYANQYPVTWKESMRAQGIAIQPILTTLADFDQLSGIAELTTDLSGKGLLADSITSNLNGQGHFLLEDGKLKGLNIAKTLRSEKTQQQSDTNSTDFAQMQGNFHIKKGVVRNNDLYIASPLFRLTGKGKIYLNPANVDYQVRPRLINSLQGQGGQQNTQGIVIPLHITGPFDKLNIAITMDKEGLLQNAAALQGIKGMNNKRQKIKQATDHAKKSAEKKLKNALKGFGF